MVLSTVATRGGPSSKVMLVSLELRRVESWVHPAVLSIGFGFEAVEP